MRFTAKDVLQAAVAILAFYPSDVFAAPVFTGRAVACSVDRNPVQLEVSVTNVRSDKGILTVTVYGENPKDFLASGKKLARVRVAARFSVTRVCLAVPEQTSYAIAVYHDENKDHRFNRSLLGLPEEGYGVSNDGISLIGIPSYSDARFNARPGMNSVQISLEY